MSNREPNELIDELNAMSDRDRRLFFEQAGLMCNTWDYTRGVIIELMFPSRTNQRHDSSLRVCRNFIRDHGYLTRVHVLPWMGASTFRRSILKPLISEGLITDSGQKWKKDGKGQAHKVFRDKTRRFEKLLNQEAPKAILSRSIVNEPLETARQFVSQVLTKEQVLKVGFTKVPGFISTLQNIGYEDVTHDSLIEWCKVVEEQIRVQSETTPSLRVYKVHNGKISIKTNTGVMKNE